jgi:hypothetical protein
VNSKSIDIATAAPVQRTEAPRLRLAARLGAIALSLLILHFIYQFAFQRLILDRAVSFADRHERLHDYGGLFLVAWQVPLSALTLLLLYKTLRPAANAKPLRRLAAAKPARWMTAATLLTAILGAFWSAIVLNGQSSVEDDDTYLFQADLIANGVLELPFPWPEFNQSFKWSWLADAPDRYFSFQMPGHCFLLAAGHLLNTPWLMPVLAVSAMIFLTCLTARQAFGRRTAILTAALLATSPYVLETQSSYSAATTGAAGVALLLYCGVRLLQKPTFILAIATGLAIGLLWFIRPPTAAFFALPLGLIMLTRVVRRQFHLTHLVVVVATSLLALFPYLLYCRALSDPPTWSLSPGGIYSERLTSPEISLLNVLSSDGHEHFKLVPNPLTSLVRLNTYIHGWPVSLIPVVILLWRRKWRGLNAWLLASCAMLFGFYAMSEKILGWYHFELMPCFAILAARSLIEIRKWLTDKYRDRAKSRHAINTLFASACLVAFLVTVPLVMSRQWRFVKDWSEPINWINSRIPEENTLVFINYPQTDMQARTALLGSNDPFLTNRIVYARSYHNPSVDAKVIAHFSDRNVYEYTCPPDTGKHQLVPIPDGQTP